MKSDDHPSERPPSRGRTLRLLVGLVLLASVVGLVGPVEAGRALLNAQPLPLAAAALLVGASTGLGAFGAILLGRACSRGLPWREGLVGFAKAWALGFLFGRMAELALPYFWKDHLQVGQSVAVVLMDKLISLAWIAVFGVMGLILLVGVPITSSTAVLAIVTSGIVVFLVLLRLGGPMIRRLAPPVLRSDMEVAGKTLRALLQEHRGPLTANALITGVRSVLHGLILLCLLAALGHAVGLLDAVGIQALTQLSGFVPGSFMGLGLWESVYVIALGSTGLAASTAVAASFLGRAVSMLWLAPLGVLGWQAFIRPAGIDTHPVEEKEQCKS